MANEGVVMSSTGIPTPVMSMGYGSRSQRPRPIPPMLNRPTFEMFQYLIQDYASNVDPAEIQSKMNELGSAGWQLLFVSPIGDNFRAWFIKGGGSAPPSSLPTIGPTPPPLSPPPEEGV